MEPWDKIFDDYNIDEHNFNKEPFLITAEQIKKSCQNFRTTGKREVRILCKHDSREKRPKIFKKLGLFLLPVKNGKYCIVKGEGYVNIPEIRKSTDIYTSQLGFSLDTSKVGNSEMQHLDYAYASSLIRTFMRDESLVLTIRGRKYTPKFEFNIGKHKIQVNGVQTEVDAGYEGKDQVVLVEAKNRNVNNIIIRQLYYPYRQWQSFTSKKVVTLFFEKSTNAYSIWHFKFKEVKDYNSIKLVNSAKFNIVEIA
ncbi:hypothetical protein KAW48_05580 [candidate division WOR-3 bacterium]|nr:hypothetical protein [candidate division WOR-3 bacterium]